MFELMSENLRICLLNEEWKVFFMHQLVDLLDYDNEAHALNLFTEVPVREPENFGRRSAQKMSFSPNEISFSNSKDFTLRDIDPNYERFKVYEIIQSKDFEFKFSKSINLYWNSLFTIIGNKTSYLYVYK